MIDNSVILYASFTAAEGNEAAVMALLSDYAETVRKEPGNRIFEATYKVDKPDCFFVYEEYENEAAFQFHLNAPYGPPFNSALGLLIIEQESQLTFLTRV